MRKKFVFVIVILLGAFLLSGCAGGPVHGSTWPGLGADGNTVYLTDGSVYAINSKDGKEVWRYPGSAKLIFHAPPTVTPEGLVIVGSDGSEYSLIALNPRDVNPESGAPVEAWKFSGARDRWVAAPLVVENKLFAPNSDGNLYILDLQDGQSVKDATVVEINGRLWARPTVDAERIYITSLDRSVTAIDINTYEILWRKDLSGAVPGSAVLGGDGMLYVGSLASQLERFDPITGEHQPVLDAENWIWSTPAVDGDTLYFGDVDGNFYSFDTATAKLNWTVKPDGPITASPLVKEEHILIATESGSIFALNRENGGTLWSMEIGGKIYTTPVMTGDLTIVAPLETEFYLSARNASGLQVWPFTPED